MDQPLSSTRAAAPYALIGALSAASFIFLLRPLLEDGLARGNDTSLHVGNVVECAQLLEASYPSPERRQLPYRDARRHPPQLHDPGS
jgi:hypothetical protein